MYRYFICVLIRTLSCHALFFIYFAYTGNQIVRHHYYAVAVVAHVMLYVTHSALDIDITTVMKQL